MLALASSAVYVSVPFVLLLCPAIAQTRGQLGDDCNNNGVECRASDGLICARADILGTPITCARKVSLGEACNEEARVFCYLPPVLRPSVGYQDTEPLVCQNGICVEPPLVPGSPCDPNFGFDCDPEGCEGRALTCETVFRSLSPRGPNIPEQLCVAKDIAKGDRCTAINIPNVITELCEEGLVCRGDFWDTVAFTGPGFSPGNFWHGVCVTPPITFPGPQQNQ